MPRGCGGRACPERRPVLPGRAVGAGVGGVAATSRRSCSPPLVLDCVRSDSRSASEISLFSAHPCPPPSLPAADLPVDLFVCLSLLLPVHSSTSLFLLFLLILSFPFLSGLPPVLKTWRYPRYLADASMCDLPCFSDANFLPNSSLAGGGRERKVEETKREPLSLPPARSVSPPAPSRRSGCLIVYGNFSLEAGRRIYRSFKCGAYKNTEEWSLRFMHS